MSNKYDITLDQHEVLNDIIEHGFVEFDRDRYTNYTGSTTHSISDVEFLMGQRMIAWSDEDDTRVIITDKGEDAHEDF